MSDSMFSDAFDVLIKLLEIYRPQIPLGTRARRLGTQTCGQGAWARHASKPRGCVGTRSGSSGEMMAQTWARALAHVRCSASAGTSSRRMQCKCGTRGHPSVVAGKRVSANVSAEVGALGDEDADGGTDVKRGGEFSKATSGISLGDGRKMVGQ